jgi:hypothetical protein
MRRGQEVTVKMETVSDFVKNQMDNFQKFNNPTVSKWDKASQRVQVKWFGQSPMWFNKEQVEKVV